MINLVQMLAGSLHARFHGLVSERLRKERRLPLPRLLLPFLKPGKDSTMKNAISGDHLNRSWLGSRYCPNRPPKFDARLNRRHDRCPPPGETGDDSFYPCCGICSGPRSGKSRRPASPTTRKFPSTIPNVVPNRFFPRTRPP